MTDITTYDLSEFDGMVKHNDGDWVRLEDYRQLEDERHHFVDDCQAMSKRIKQLEKDNEFYQDNVISTAKLNGELMNKVEQLEGCLKTIKEGSQTPWWIVTKLNH